MGKIFIAILAIFLLLGAFRSPIIDGIKGMRIEEQSQGFAVVTGVGASTANVTLSSDLYQDDTAEVTSITSNETGDAPVASTYTAATKVLLVSGLESSKNHSLTIDYNAD